ncbi:fimbrial protein [Serratia marcescens]|uniref:fimbrial protein n=1 Tax=Serratia marcescens TaxID=615 RepID=UPI0036FD5BC0
MQKQMALRLFSLLALLMGQPIVSLADNMSFYGLLVVPPPCTINDNGVVDVNFGARLGVNKVDGVNYRQGVNYQITCENGANPSMSLTLSLSGTVTAFDKEALQTNKENLGIRIYQNDRPFTPGSKLVIGQASSRPRLEAVPVKKTGAALTEGAFEAWATLRAEYQ